MNNTKFNNAKQAISITVTLTLIVAGYEVLRACQNYIPGMNLFDIASFANADLNTYCLVLILANIILLPKALLLFKENGISLKDEIYSEKTLGKDIALGIALAVVSLLVGLIFLFINKGRTELAFTGWENLSAGEMTLGVIALGAISGICKEIYFRGLAKLFCGNVFGETAALVLLNVLFGMLDWFNFGFSFVAGLIWIWGYKKSGKLIVPMIAHGTYNIIGLMYYCFM